MSRFLASRFQSLNRYVPGEQPTGADYIKLNTNESPYPPAPAVIAALTKAELDRTNLYPDPDGAELRKKLAGHYGVGLENIIIGNGSDELLAFSFLAFCTGARGVAFPDITYGFYPVYAKLYDINADIIPLRDDFTIDLSDYVGRNKNIILANPNAPTGITLSLSDIEMIVTGNPDHVVLIDEAYVDFGTESAVDLTHKYDNLLVMHTYSKSRSLAGARLAYAIGSAPIIDDLYRMKDSFNSYNVSRMTQLMGIAAIIDDAYYIEKRRQIIDTRDYTVSMLRDLGFSMTDSHANFLFVKHSIMSGKELYTALKEHGLLVRHWDSPRISDYLRITIGTQEQMEALGDALRNILKTQGHLTD